MPSWVIAPFEPQHRAERRQRQRASSCGCSSAKASSTTRRVVAWTRGLATVSSQWRELGVQIVEVAEGAGEEEVLADVAVRPLDLALGLGPVGPAGPRVEAVVASKVDQRTVVDDAALGVLADHRGLHPVVEDLARHAAERREGGDVAAQHGLQVLVQARSGPRAGGCGRAPSRTARRSAVTAGSSVNATWNWAKSTCAWSPGGVSKRTSKAGSRGGRSSRRKSVTAV